MKFRRISLLIIGLLFSLYVETSWAQCIGGPTLDLSISTDANNTVTLEGCANGDFQASDGTDDWAGSVVTIRIPDNDSNFPIMAQDPSTQVSFVSNGSFGGITLVPAFNTMNNDIITFTLDQVGGTYDGYIYMQFVDNVASPNHPLSDGTCETLLEIDFPDSWTCNDCVELVDANQGGAIFTGTRTGNSGCGGDVSNHADPFTTLPIELTTFEARTADCDVLLYWETATEQDFGYYQIEASRDGRSFEAVGQQKPASPNSLETRRYKYKVPAKYQDHYFRLKAIDLDGSFEYSHLVFAKAPCLRDKYSMSLYPNPNFTSRLTVEVNSAIAAEQAQLHILNAQGQIIQLQKVDIAIGSNLVQVDTEELASGTYYVRIIGIEQLSEPLKFVRSNF